MRALRLRAARIAEALGVLATSSAGAADAVRRLQQLTPQVAGRGACAHPNGAARLVESALSVFAAEIDAHRRGRCIARSHDPLLPIPQVGREWR